ncbi:hypothetical protein TGME49_315700 [Toxoplasma gondii ME49]|uniref:GYF domain protein n=3 Tax=Toxoplasma gondii TaxID=5811 RepID=B6K9M4_TOXGV|nr:hypothetical protein TGME49_315700 [Toxoplasma gondii ME49]EPT25715.1 hypothetical protein TGME49_315700 [Toxoplasma gondii ME49]ESS35323.1 GYF domain protein [Toxoplasma gondii VEG]KFG36727.1 GYF domain protein [Toxoplasma gondii GAB2-2007-GAL-DOM2]CEL77770.1 TPA: hypothetical protein BN1205_100830 [Toxoplasma gondii VEG]|eukprot:XP_002364748.1 hypothetical protein TGME49_315700 [Toxoplasma gondii ME49]
MFNSRQPTPRLPGGVGVCAPLGCPSSSSGASSHPQPASSFFRPLPPASSRPYSPFEAPPPASQAFSFQGQSPAWGGPRRCGRSLAAPPSGPHHFDTPASRLFHPPPTSGNLARPPSRVERTAPCFSRGRGEFELTGGPRQPSSRDSWEPNGGCMRSDRDREGLPGRGSGDAEARHSARFPGRLHAGDGAWTSLRERPRDFDRSRDGGAFPARFRPNSVRRHPGLRDEAVDDASRPPRHADAHAGAPFGPLFHGAPHGDARHPRAFPDSRPQGVRPCADAFPGGCLSSENTVRVSDLPRPRSIRSSPAGDCMRPTNSVTGDGAYARPEGRPSSFHSASPGFREPQAELRDRGRCGYEGSGPIPGGRPTDSRFADEFRGNHSDFFPPTQGHVSLSENVTAAESHRERVNPPRVFDSAEASGREGRGYALSGPPQPERRNTEGLPRVSPALDRPFVHPESGPRRCAGGEETSGRVGVEGNLRNETFSTVGKPDAMRGRSPGRADSQELALTSGVANSALSSLGFSLAAAARPGGPPFNAGTGVSVHPAGFSPHGQESPLSHGTPCFPPGGLPGKHPFALLGGAALPLLGGGGLLGGQALQPGGPSRFALSQGVGVQQQFLDSLKQPVGGTDSAAFSPCLDSKEANGGEKKSAEEKEKPETDQAPENPNESRLLRELSTTPPALLNPESNSAAHNWWYLDNKNKCQGPFDTLQVLRWFEGGFFDAQRLFRRDDEVCFTPVDDGKRITEVAARIVNVARTSKRAAQQRQHPIRVLCAPVPPPSSSGEMSLEAKVQQAQAALAPLFDLAKKTRERPDPRHFAPLGKRRKFW